MRATERVIGYLKKSPVMCILLSSTSDLRFYAYSDSDWAACPMSRKSVTGYFITVGSSSISWKSKKQNTVSRSCAEVEYRSMAATACEIIWLHGILTDMAFFQHTNFTTL